MAKIPSKTGEPCVNPEFAPSSLVAVLSALFNQYMIPARCEYDDSIATLFIQVRGPDVNRTVELLRGCQIPLWVFAKVIPTDDEDLDTLEANRFPGWPLV